MLQILHDTRNNYQIETVPILFYPNGSRYRARYKTKNIDQSILHAVTQDQFAYVGQAAIVCLRYNKDFDDLPDGLVAEYENILVWRSKDRLVPVRHAVVDEIKIEGILIHVVYKLGRYYSPKGSDAKELISQSVALNDNIEGTTQVSIGNQTLLTMVPDDRFNNFEDNRVHDAERWQRLIGQFSLVGGLVAVPYPRLERIREIRDGKFANAIDLEISKDSSALQLKAGLTYCITVTDGYPQEFFRPKPYKSELDQSQREYKLELDDCFVSALPQRTALGGYDQCEFVLQVRDSAEGRCGEIQLKRVSQNGISSRVATDFSIPYEVLTNVQQRRQMATWFGLGLLVERIIASPSIISKYWPSSIAENVLASVTLSVVDGALIIATAYFFVDYLISKHRHQELER
jgi:hypothetical protein